MKICEDGHYRIVHREDACPLCAAIDGRFDQNKLKDKLAIILADAVEYNQAGRDFPLQGVSDLISRLECLIYQIEHPGD